MDASQHGAMGSKWKQSLEMWTGKMGQLASVWYVWMQLWWAWECVWGWCLHFKWMLKKNSFREYYLEMIEGMQNVLVAYLKQHSMCKVAWLSFVTGIFTKEWFMVLHLTAERDKNEGHVAVRSSWSLKGERVSSYCLQIYPECSLFLGASIPESCPGK